ncbi:MAG: response regulator transcription factor, partial [Ramlibacter sp.]
MADKRHALIVEDEADAAGMVAALVADRGYSAATAPTLHDARRQLALQPPDLLMLDLRLPDGNGLSLLQEDPGNNARLAKIWR